MLFFLAVSALAVAAIGSVVSYQRAAGRQLSSGEGKERKLPAPAQKIDERGEVTPHNLRVGDVVIDESAGGVDYWIVGCISYAEEQRAWKLFCLEGGENGKRFLEVGFPLLPTGNHEEMVLFQLAPRASAAGHFSEGLTFEGQSYRLKARGDARTSVEGETFSRGAGLLRYARYHGATDSVLWWEDEGKERRTYLGTSLPSTLFTLYPGEKPQPDETAYSMK